MSDAVRIRKNSFYSTLSISSRLIANVFVFWIIARYYGPEIFGQFKSAQVLATNFIILADFGFDILLTTEVARNRINAVYLYRQFYSLKLMFSLFTFTAMWLLSLFGNFSQETRTLIQILSFYTIFTTLTNHLFALYKGFEKLEYETKVSLFINVGLILILFPLIILKINIFIIALVFVFTRFFGFIVAIIYSFKLIPNISFRISFDGFSEIKNKVFIFGFFLLFNNLFFQLDTILLSLWRGDKSVGVYQAAFMLIMLPLIIPDIFINTLMPFLSRLNVENQVQWKRAGYLMNKILIAVAIPISIILFAFSEQIIKIIYGSRAYSETIPILRIFAITLLVRFSLESYALMLTTSERQKIRLITVIVATLLNFILNYFLIPIYGPYGAALVSLITNIFVGIIYYATNYKLVSEYLLNYKVLMFVLVSLIMAYFSWLLRDINLFISIPVLGLIFIFIIYYIFFTKSEIELMFSKDFKLMFTKKK
ncbi:MAG: flippase [Melioribacter sp.]|nr:flippase [Melioribacter sp.]